MIKKRFHISNVSSWAGLALTLANSE